MKHNYEMEKVNVRVRPLEEKDIECLRLWRNNPQNCKYLRKIPYITEEQQKSWFKNYLTDCDEMTFAIDEISELHELVGSASLYNIKEDEVEFGKILIGNECAHGKKVGLNATKAILEIAFTKLSVNNVVLKCYTENQPALHIYHAAGFEVVEQRMTAESRMEYKMRITKKKYVERQAKSTSW